jgi:hypothetical protein
MVPARPAATPAPIMWAANTQPKTTDDRATPNCWRQSATVGGTVATQSSP